jgi:hypothetical protein
MRALIVGEVALACSLLVGSALLLRSFANLAHADRGVDLADVMSINLAGLDKAFPSVEAMAAGTAAIETDVATWPEIQAFALSREVPPSVRANRINGDAGRSGGDMRADHYRVSPAFFGFFGIPIVRGRNFAAGDRDRAAIVGERLARQLWPDVDPIGQIFAFGNGGATRVIGVAGEIHLPTLDRDLDRPEFYSTLGNASRTLIISVRCRGTCPSEAAIRTRLSSIHPSIGARIDPPADNEYLNHLRLPRALAEVAGLFAIVAVLAASGGLFSVMTYTVGRRRREFGIRMALGASRADMRRLVFRDGLTTVVVGAVIGCGGGWMVARALARFHYGVSAADPLAWGCVMGALVLASLAAAWRPARAAMHVNPVQLLRGE